MNPDEPYFRTGGEDFVRNFALYFTLKRADGLVTPEVYRIAYEMPPNKPEFLSLILGRSGETDLLGDRAHCEFEIKYIPLSSGQGPSNANPIEVVQGNEAQGTHGWHIVFDASPGKPPLAVELPTPARFATGRFYVSTELLQLAFLRERLIRQILDFKEANDDTISQNPLSGIRTLNKTRYLDSLN